MKYFALLLILIAGCTTTTEVGIECPTLTCPEPAEPPPVQEPASLIIYKLDSGLSNTYVGINDTVSIYNCGSAAYGPITTSAIKALAGDTPFKDLIITTSAIESIGGCADIIQQIPEIQKVKLYEDSGGYEEVVKWVPPQKLERYEYPFIFVYNDDEIFLEDLIEPVNEIR